MNIVCQFMTKNPVHFPMPAYRGQGFKNLTDQDHLKMRLGTGRNIMVAAFIDDFQMLQSKCLRKFLYYSFLNYFFLVRHVVTKLGIGRSLAIMPIISFIGFAYLAIDPILGVVALLTIARRGLGFAFSKPPTDMLYSVVTAEEKYKAKNFIDTAIYRFGDIVGTWSVKLMMSLSIAGKLIVSLSIAGVSVVMLPFAALWLFYALWLGREYKRKAIALKDQGLT